MATSPPSPARAIWPYALAYAGVVTAYTPLLTLILPDAVARVAGADRYGALALVLCVGAVAAGASNLLFGMASDAMASGAGRRRLMAFGLAGTALGLAAVGRAQGVAGFAAAVALFQLALNAVIAPLLVVVAQEVPRSRTGLVTGLFAAGPLVGTLAGRALAGVGWTDPREPLAAVAAASVACVAPMLLARPATAVAEPPPPSPVRGRRGLAAAWGSRLLVQVAGNLLFTDLIYVMDDATPAGIARTGTLILLANLLPLPIATLAGRRIDRGTRGRVLLCAVAAVAAAGLAAMAADGGDWRAAGFLVFATGWGVFLPLQVGHVIRLLPDPTRRGRDLGLVNLANTLPVFVGQGLAWRLAAPHDTDLLLAVLAALTLAGGLLMLAAPVSRTPGTP